MKSTPGSARATPLAGEVKLVPSIRNVFSLAPEPNADTREFPAVPGEVAEMPGAAPMKSNMLERRVGIALIVSGPKWVPNPLPRASRFDPRPSTTTDSVTLATVKTAVRSMVAPAPMLMSPSWYFANPCASMSSAYDPGGSAGNRSCPFSFVITVDGPPINAGEVTRTTAPGMTPPCASLTVPMRAPVSPCAAVTRGNTTHAAAHNRNRVLRDLVPGRLSQRDDAFNVFPPTRDGSRFGRQVASHYVARDRLVRAKISLNQSR